MKKIILLLLAQAFLNAFSQHKDIIKSFNEAENDSARVAIILNFYDFESNLPPPDSMMYYYMAFKNISEEKKDEEAESVNIAQMAYYVYINGDLPRGFQLITQALHIAERTKNARVLGMVNFGMQYFADDENKKIDYVRKAISFSKEANDTRFLTYEYRNLGQRFLSLKMLDSAAFYYQQSYHLSLKRNAKSDIVFNLVGLGRVNYRIDNKKVAIEYYRQAEAIMPHPTVYIAIANYFRGEKNNDSTILYAKTAYNASKRLRIVNYIIGSTEILKGVYTGLNSDSALNYTNIYYTMRDSVYGRKKIEQVLALNFEEEIRQQKNREEKEKAFVERRHNLQYTAIAIGMITFIILFLALSRSIIVKEKFIKFFGILGLLAVFEFINLYIHPYLSKVTNDSPVLMLCILVAIGALLIPLHHRLEKWIIRIMVEKNKKIRLAAAKKTIATLEKEM